MAEEIISVIRHLSTVSSFKEGLRGKINMVASEVPGECVAPCLISNFKLSNPQVDFSLKIMDSFSALEMLASGEANLAMVQLIRGLRRLMQNFDYVEVAKDRLVAIVPIDHELSGRSSVKLRVIAGYPLISGEENLELASFLREIFRVHNVKMLNVKMRFGSIDAIITSVSQGLGVSIISEIMARKAENSGLVKTLELEAQGIETPIYMVKKRGETYSALKYFWSYVVQINERFGGYLPCLLKLVAAAKQV
jgi:DNA-binding transcriptional LysR family regulator